MDTELHAGHTCLPPGPSGVRPQKGAHMPFAKTAPLCRAIERMVPDRPFTIQFWDGTAVPATRGDGPTLSLRSPQALSHLLRKPGQIGLGRAYVTGQLEVDDLDALNRVIYAWQPPKFRARSQFPLMLAAARAAGVRLSPRPPTADLQPRGTLLSRSSDAHFRSYHSDL